MTMQDFLELYLTTYIEPKRAKNTVRAYRFALAHLSPEIMAADVAAVDPIQLQREINLLAAVYSRQAQLMYQALRQALQKCERLGMIDRSPMDRVDPPAHEKRETKILTQSEAMAYFAEAEAFPLLRLMLCLGLRRNEARGLRFGDFDGQVLHIRYQRTASGLAPLKSRASRRDLPVPEALWPIFQGANGDFVEDVSENTLRRQHLTILRRIGVEGVTLHGLRHTAATLAAGNDVPLSTIQHFLGHRHVSLTADLYVHADLRTLARCAVMIYNSFGRSLMGNGARLEIV